MCHLTILTSQNRSSTFSPSFQRAPYLLVFLHQPPPFMKISPSPALPPNWSEVLSNPVRLRILNFGPCLSHCLPHFHFFAQYLANNLQPVVDILELTFHRLFLELLIVILRRIFPPYHFSSHHTVMLWVLAITACFERNVVGNAAGTFKLRPAASKIRP